MADVATIVDENVNGVRVVKSLRRRASARSTELGPAARAPAVGHRCSQVDTRARYAPVHGEPAPARAGRRAALRRVAGDRRPGPDRHARRLQRLRRPAAGAVPHARLLPDAGPAGAPRRPSGSTRSSTRARPIVDRPGAVDLVDPAGAVEFRRRHASATRRPATPRRCSTASTSTRRAGRDRRDRRPHRQRQVDRRPAAPPLLRRRRRRGAASTATTSATSRSLSLRRHVGIVLDEPFLFSVSVRDNIAYGRPDATDARGRGRGPGGPGPRVHHATCPTATTPSSASAATRCRAASASASPSPARCWSTRGSSCSTTPPAPSTSRSRSAIHDALATLLADRTTIVIAHRLSTIGLADRVVLLEGGRVVAERHPRRAAGHRAPLRRGRWPTLEDERVELARARRPASRDDRDGAPDGRGGPPADGVRRGSAVQASAAAAACPSPACPPSWPTEVEAHPGRRARAPRARGPLHPARPGDAGRSPCAASSPRTAPRCSAAFALVVLETIALQAGPLLTQIGIDNGIIGERHPGPRRRGRRLRR